MPSLPYSIELHDSVLTDIERIERDYVLRLRPAYVHREGNGWTQDIDLVLLDAEVITQTPALPARIADGSMRTPNGPYHNLLTLPLTELGAVVLTLEFFDESVLEVASDGVHAVVQGPLAFVEAFP
jgi:hypothetical protein